MVATNFIPSPQFVKVASTYNFASIPTTCKANLSIMASVLRATTEISRDKGKGKSRAGANGTTAEDGVEKPTTKPRKDKVLLISSRGVTQRMRHLMNDLEALLPHIKKGEDRIVHSVDL